MGRRGRKRQLDVETEYRQLLKAGVGTVAACRLVGITRKTGYRWRRDRRHPGGFGGPLVAAYRVEVLDPDSRPVAPMPD
jgi:transposase-like protein